MTVRWVVSRMILMALAVSVAVYLRRVYIQRRRPTGHSTRKRIIVGEGSHRRRCLKCALLFKLSGLGVDGLTAFDLFQKNSAARSRCGCDNECLNNSGTV